MNDSRARKKEFNKIYKESILPNIQDIEEIRKKEYTKYLIISFIFLIIFVLSCFCFISLAIYYKFFAEKLIDNYNFFISPKDSWFYIFISVILMYVCPFCYCIYLGVKNLELKQLTKNNGIYQKILNIISNVKWYSHDVNAVSKGDEILSISKIKNSGLFIDYQIRFTDDEFTGVYKDVPFIISETKMGNDAVTSDYFKKPLFCEYEGIIILFDLNKKVRNRTIVATKNDFTAKNQVIYSVIVIIAIMLYMFIPLLFTSYIMILIPVIIGLAIYMYYIEKKDEKKREPLNQVILEDPKFGKRFNVYSSDQVEARYLVTPAFMERLYNLQTAFGSKKLKCSFFNNQFMISIATKKDLFEICSLNKPTKEVIYDFYNELNSIYQMIDYFKLYEKIYLMK